MRVRCKISRDVQKGRSARPQRAKCRGVYCFHPPTHRLWEQAFTRSYVKALNDARTQPAAFFNISLTVEAGSIKGK
jgi:hypothetical protein